MWKRFKVLMAMALIGILCLTACGTENLETEEAVSENMGTDEIQNEDLAESEPTELTGELTIMVWLSYAENVWQPVADAFMEEHPGVTIKIDAPLPEEDQTEAFMKKYVTRIMTGEGFDIVEASPIGMDKYGADQNLFVDLYEYMDADEEFDRADYFPCIFEPVETDGKLFKLVYSVQPQYVWLNKKMLEQAGLEYTQDTISFNKMYELYEKVRESAGEKIFLTDSQYGYEGLSTYENTYFILNNLMDSEEYGEYLQRRHELYYTAENRSTWSDGKIRVAADSLCNDGESLRLSDSIAIDNAFTETEDVTAALLYEGMHGEHYCNGDASLSISSFSQNKELAWEFLKFVVSNRDAEPTETAYISPNREKVIAMCERLNPETKERLLQDIEAIDAISFWDTSLYSNLTSVYEDYFLNNSITLEECQKELADRVYLYMNE